MSIATVICGVWALTRIFSVILAGGVGKNGSTVAVSFIKQKNKIQSEMYSFENKCALCIEMNKLYLVHVNETININNRKAKKFFWIIYKYHGQRQSLKKPKQLLVSNIVMDHSHSLYYSAAFLLHFWQQFLSNFWLFGTSLGCSIR